MTSEAYTVALITFGLGNFTGAALLFLYLLLKTNPPAPAEVLNDPYDLPPFPGPIYDEWGNPTIRYLDASDQQLKAMFGDATIYRSGPPLTQADYERIKAEWKKSHGSGHTMYLPAWDTDTDLE